MSVLFRYPVSGLTRAQHDKVGDKMRDEGTWPPEGLQLHVLFGEEGNLMVSEIWDSEEQQQAFAPHLRPALEAAGVQMNGAPEMFPVQAMEP